MSYSVKEIFYTLQGEGANTGRPAVFCRFSGCNLWSGLEKDRAAAICSFCDTDFIGIDGQNGGKYKTAEELSDKILSLWPNDAKNCFVVFTGGEPLLQIDSDLIKECKSKKIILAVETNGTIIPPDGIDWVCVSPKAGTKTVLVKGNEIKIAYPQEGLNPVDFANHDFDYFYIQPIDNNNKMQNTLAAINFCKSTPKWRLSIQAHKILNIP